MITFYPQPLTDPTIRVVTMHAESLGVRTEAPSFDAWEFVSESDLEVSAVARFRPTGEPSAWGECAHRAGRECRNCR